MARTDGSETVAVGDACRVLVVEDSSSLAATYRMMLEKQGYSVDVAGTGTEALTALAAESYGAMVLDVRLPDMTGLEILDRLRAQGNLTEAVVITSDGSINLAVDAMRRGAFDFIVKPMSPNRLTITVGNAVERGRQRRNGEPGPSEEATEGRFCRFIGSSKAMQAVYRTIRSAAPSNATVFVLGESGTGKELCAEAIHRSSRRSSGPFVTLNCAAIPADLLESEIFGHVKGAFSGATADRKGAALSANGGTLFLDEICEMDINLQAKLLRFLQNREVQRLGEEHIHHCDVRIVCATNRDPLAQVRAGRFREDLYYRLHVIPLELPPLRARDGDVLEIAEHFLKRFVDEEQKHFTGFSAAARRLLSMHDWAGNVRQLENLVRRLVVLNDGPVIEAEMVPEEFGSAAQCGGFHAATPSIVFAGQAPRGEEDRLVHPLEQTIRRAIEGAIDACGGSVPKAAQMLQVSPSTLYRRLEGWATHH